MSKWLSACRGEGGTLSRACPSGSSAALRSRFHVLCSIQKETGTDAEVGGDMCAGGVSWGPGFGGKGRKMVSDGAGGLKIQMGGGRMEKSTGHRRIYNLII